MKNFLFYAGNARAGSTWLHGALNARGDCDFGPYKEYFLFTGYNPHQNFDKSNYYDMFAIRAENSNVKLMGDISPSNAYASVQDLAIFNDEMSSRGFVIKPVMTLRDPINQILSWTKMQCMARGINSVIDSNLIMEIGKQPFEPISWRQTYENFTRVFGLIHFNFYETLFCDQSMMQLEDYLNIPHVKYDFDKIVFSFGKANELTENDKQFLFENYPFYKEDYNFAVEKFGKDFIESIWWTPNK